MKFGNVGRVFLLLLAGAFTALGCMARETADCPGVPEDEPRIVEALRTMLAAAGADDLSLFHSVATPDFYSFDNGKRFDGDALMNLIKTSHAAGNKYLWSVNEPQVHVSCTLAWVTYINRGSLQSASGNPQPREWLESAVLQKGSAGNWRIRFFHSTRVP